MNLSSYHKYYSSILFLLILLSSSSLWSMVNFCKNTTGISPAVGYSYANARSMTGGELSLWGGSICGWGGVYGEYYTGLNDSHKVGAGGFIGFLMLGLDIAAISYFDKTDSYLTARFRPFITFGFVNFYYGILTSPGDLDIGILFKIPLCHTGHFLNFKFGSNCI